MKESCVSDWELDGADFMAFLEGQYNLDKRLINSPANQGIFFADSDVWFVAGNWSMVAMYVAWTANCIYGWYNWSKLNKQQTT